MALILCRITDPYECIRCDVPYYKLLAYGDEYFLDTNDGAIIDFNYAYDRKWAAKKEEGYNKAQHYMENLDYISSLKEKKKKYMKKKILNKKK